MYSGEIGGRPACPRQVGAGPVDGVFFLLTPHLAVINHLRLEGAAFAAGVASQKPGVKLSQRAFFAAPVQ